MTCSVWVTLGEFASGSLKLLKDGRFHANLKNDPGCLSKDFLSLILADECIYLFTFSIYKTRIKQELMKMQNRNLNSV